MPKFAIGDKVRDRYTGAEGVIVAARPAAAETPGYAVEWLDAVGHIAGYTFDESRLILIETSRIRDEIDRQQQPELRHSMPIRQPADLRREPDDDEELGNTRAHGDPVGDDELGRTESLNDEAAT